MESIEDVRSRSAYGAALTLRDAVTKVEEFLDEVGEEEEGTILWVVRAMDYAAGELDAMGKGWEEHGRTSGMRPPGPE